MTQPEFDSYNPDIDFSGGQIPAGPTQTQSESSASDSLYPSMPDYGNFELNFTPGETAVISPEDPGISPSIYRAIDEILADAEIHPPVNTQPAESTDFPSEEEPTPEESDAAEAADSVSEETDSAQHEIVDLDEATEDGELESAYIRRVARRQAHRAAHNPADAPLEEDALHQLHSEHSRRSWSEKLLAPVIRRLALAKARQKLREQEAAAWPAPVTIRQTDELPAEKAARYYERQMRSMKHRLRILLVLVSVMLWLGFSLPLPGPVGSNPRMQAAVLLVFLLSAMICGLDIITTGLRQLFALQPAMEALCAAACVMSLFDAALCACGVTDYLPFCAAAGFSLLTGLWSEYLRCRADSLNLSAAVPREESTVLFSVKEDSELNALIHSRSDAGIVRRSEEPDGGQNSYAVAAPILLVLSLLLALLSAIGGGWDSLLHNFCAYLAVCANGAGFLCFALPWLMAVFRLHGIGAAIAGWAGCAEIGRSPRVIITENDIFPAGTVKIDSIYTPDIDSREKVISYAVSVLRYSGSSIAAAFDLLMQRKKYALLTVEDFKCNDGGGLSAYIHGETVLVGSYGFMKLNGVSLPNQLPEELTWDNAIFVAIRNRLAGIFVMQYLPTVGPHRALQLLLQGKTHPVFAIRDFTITPLMIQRLFHLDTLGFEFPSFRERFRLSSLRPQPDSVPAAILGRPGVRCAVETAEIGRKLYISCIACTALSLLSCALGLLIVFLGLQHGSVEAISSGRLLLYSILWTLPDFFWSYWLTK